MDAQHFSDSIIIQADAASLYRMISDVTRMGEWSPQCRACRWDEGEGPVVGAHFTGHNESPERVWETRSQVVVADPNREFAWIVEGCVRWGYTMEALDGAAPSTRLTESWHLFDEGVAELKDRYGNDAEKQIAMRGSDARSGIPATLAAMKATAEADCSG